MVENEHNESVRPPTREDLAKICGDLNKAGAKYIVLGGMALIELGLGRATMDIDLLVDASPENIRRVREALSSLQDGASLEVKDSDVAEYNVVRINDEITIDLMGKACGIDYDTASSQIAWRELDGVMIPFASVELLWKTKQTYREKDALDRSFLRRLAGKSKSS